MSKNNTMPLEQLTQWFVDGKYGVMIHFLGDYRESGESWNQRVNAFDVKAFARQLHEIGAGHVLFTVSQCGGRFCMPLASYDKILKEHGWEGTLCSERDLIADLYDALEPYGINLLLYAAAEGPVSGDLRQIFTWNSVETDGMDAGPCGKFEQYWFSMLKEISDRYGKKIKGWWIDGCYGHYPCFADPDSAFAARLIDALQSGNPDAITALNCGISVGKVSNAQEYTCGESDKLIFFPEDRFVDGMQWHALSYLGPWWTDHLCARSNIEVVNYVKKCTDKGGVVTFDVGYNGDGTICDEHYDQLKTVKRFIKETDSFDEADIPESANYLANMWDTVMPEIPADWVNVALHKPCTASSYFNEGYRPENGVDGDIDSGWAGGVVNPGELFWQVDLTAETDISGLEYYTRNGNNCERRNFEIRGSLTPDFAEYDVLLHQGDFPLPMDMHWSAVYDAPIRTRYVRVVPNGKFSIPFVSELKLFVKP